MYIVRGVYWARAKLYRARVVPLSSDIESGTGVLFLQLSNRFSISDNLAGIAGDFVKLSSLYRASITEKS
jgi:hypothetical protein